MAVDAEELSRRVLDDFEARIQNDRFATRYNDIVIGRIKASEGAEELRKTSIRDLQGALHAIKDDLPENIDYEYAKKLYEPVLRRAFEIHSDIAREAQQEKNEEAGLGLKAQAADFPEDKIDGFAKAVSKYENKKDGFWLMDKPIDHFIRSTYDDTVKKNAEFQSKAGLRPRIIRKASADACEWCRAMAGTYDYPDKVPHDVYRRHENCTCTVEYDPGSGKRVQNAWTKRWTREEERDKIEARKQIGTGIIPIKRKNSSLENGLPLFGKADSIVDKVDDDGQVLQRRIYDASGKALIDYDTTDHGAPWAHPTGAHKHIFDHRKSNPHGKALPLTEEELKENLDIIKRGVNYHD